jgi:LysM repeat protein
MPTRSQPLVLVGALAIAVAAGTLITASASANDRVIVVAPGQTLSQIALDEGVSIARLVALNGLADPNRIYAGQRLVVESSAPAAPAAQAAPAAAPTHRVAYGENLTGIARRYGTTIAAIVAANGIANPSFIRSGQVLTLPVGAPAAAPAKPAAKPAPARTHRVAYGENLTGIARRHGTTIAAIVAANGIANPSFLRVGQVLTIPGAAAAVAPAAPGATMPTGMAALVAQRDGIRRLIVDEANRQGVPPAFALAVAWQESGWQAGVVSSANAIGVMQLLPATGEWVSQAMLGVAPVNLWDPASNVRAGVRLLRHYLDRYGGDRSLVLAAYYQGQTAADRHGVFAISRPYIASILRLESIFSR